MKMSHLILILAVSIEYKLPDNKNEYDPNEM